ncbi:MAG: Gldg family protein [Deltaproteobacteria bacterium]|nr:Gldg family protein [Deltaproteobacteria bacterium]
MKANERSGNLFKFFIYLVVVILINVAGFTLFFRLDLTSNRAFSISEVSKKAVSTLEEPLTIYVFFTENLPAPYNSVEKYLHDLLEEYALSGNRYFNYRFYDVSTQEGGLDEEVRKNQELAESYGIRPVQIQVLDQDEFKFKMAYMGLVIMHGDLVERIPAISSTDRLEYRLTTTIQKLNNKISSFQKLEENIKVKLFLSSSLEKIAPFIGVETFSGIPEKVSETIEKLKVKTFGKLEYVMLDPSTDPSIEEQVKKYDVMTMEWPELPEKSVSAGKGSIGIFVEYKGNALEIPLLERFQIPFIGGEQMNTLYQLVDMTDVEEVIQKSIESLIDINENLGYLADHGSINLWGRDFNMPGMPSQGSVSRFNEMASATYSVKEVKLTDRDILNGLNCIIIASPKEPFTDYELFRIDQFLMQGKSIALFMDSFEELPSQQGGGGQYRPIDTGLEKLLNHWGINIEKSIVLDQDCYKAELPAEYGGGEQPLYYVSQVNDEMINKKLPFIKDIRGLLVQKSSPVVLDEKLISEKGLTIHKLFSSSEKSWEMKETINLNPMMISPPSPDTPLKSIPLAYTIEGAFTSYFADKPVPEAVMKDEKEGEDDTPEDEGAAKTKAEEKPAIDAGMVKSEEKKIEKGRPGKLFIAGTSYLLDNSVISPDGGNVNSIFIMNLIDYLNGREETAVMRSKTGSLNPLARITPWAKSGIKFFNIIGLPVIVALFGLFIWGLRHRRKLAIQDAFKRPVNMELKE